MKKLFYAALFLVIHSAANAQQKLHDGVYLVDKFTPDPYQTNYANKALVTFNACFIEATPEEYSPLLVFTDDFVPFEFSMPPITQMSKHQHKILYLKLTKGATEKLNEFTSKNLRRYVVIVVNGEAITVHKIKEPITSGLVQIASATDDVHEQLYRLMKNNVKESDKK